MTTFHWVQIALGAWAIAVGIVRLRVMLFDSNLDAVAFASALEGTGWGDDATGRRLIEAAHPAWVAMVAASVLDERSGEVAPGHLAELLVDLRREAQTGIRTLRTIGRAASPLAFVGVMIELGMAFHGDHGLLALQRGLVQQLALQNAITGVTLGLTTSLCCYVAAVALHRAARARLREVNYMHDALEAVVSSSVPRTL